MLFKKCSIMNTIFGNPEIDDDNSSEDMAESGR
jgi:hypothetical protein